MKYLLNDSNDLSVEIMTHSEYLQQYPPLNDGSQLFEMSVYIKHTKVQLMPDYIYGSLFLPELNYHQEHACLFYLNDARLTIIEDHPWMQDILKDILIQTDEDLFENPSQILSLILEWMVYSQEGFLDAVEAQLKIEEQELLNNNGIPKLDLDHEFHLYGRQLLSLKRYYQQLTDICDLLEDYLREKITRIERRKLQYITQHSARLAEDANDLREYVIQLRDIYNADISNKQNRIMQILTVVTTLFMPLTLLTGWYGMNFQNMPELKNPNGYFILIAIALGIVLFEFVLFKKKKWLE